WLFCFASILTLLFVFFYRYGHNRDLHSFPTRRSSDLSSLVLDFQRMGGTVLISEIEEDPFEMLEMSGLSEVIGEDHFFKTTTERSEEHTSELQSRFDLVCRLLLEKKKTNLGKESKTTT